MLWTRGVERPGLAACEWTPVRIGRGRHFSGHAPCSTVGESGPLPRDGAPGEGCVRMLRGGGKGSIQ